MLLNRTVEWVLNNPILLAVQDVLVSPVLKRLPATRYERIRYDRNVLFKMFGIGAGTLVRVHLEKKNIDLSLRYASEIVSNQGYIFYSQDWKTYLLYVGLIHAYRKDYEQASSWLAEGFVKQEKRILHSVKTQSYPASFITWLNNNIDKLKTAGGWQAIFEESKHTEDDLELLLIYISVCIFSLQLPKLVVAFLDACETKHHSDWEKMIRYRQAEFLLPDECEALEREQIWGGTYPDIGQKLAANLLYRTLSDSAFLEPGENQELLSLGKLADYEHVNHQLFGPVMMACHFLVQSRFVDTVDLLTQIVNDNGKYLDSIRSRLGPKKLFLAGFGWSGSSAVHDACRGYPHTKDMPGAGDLEALNVGADSEPMLHQGAGALGEIVRDIKADGRISAVTLKRFFKNHALLMAPFDYLEYKTVNATKSIIDHVGLDRYYLLLCDFLHQYAAAMCAKDKAKAIEAAESLQENTVNAMYADDDIVFFNNSVFAHRAKILEHVRGRSYYIVVNRQMADQFCDQIRSNKFFSATFLEFYLVKLNRVLAYRSAKKSSNNESLEFIDIMFEDWVQDASLREDVARKLCDNYDKKVESEFFDPQVSQQNIGISRDELNVFDRTCLGFFEKTGLSI